jgi:hypothetical protein
MNSSPSQQPTAEVRIAELEQQVRHLVLLHIAQLSALAASIPDVVVDAADRLQQLGTLAVGMQGFDRDQQFAAHWSSTVSDALQPSLSSPTRSLRARDLAFNLFREFAATMVTRSPSAAGHPAAAPAHAPT